MDDHVININGMTNPTTPEIPESNLQKPNIYNKYSPFYEIIKRQSAALFEEIRENLSRTIQLGELEPGFSIWSNKLKQFIALYGFSFTKADHLKLINYYISILSIPDLNYIHVQICFDVLYELLRRTHLITRDDLTIDWRIFYVFAQVIFGYEDKICRLVILPEGIRGSLDHCVQSCSPYFSASATQEILDEFRPQMCPVVSSFNTTIKMLELFLPVILLPDLHHQGFKLWLPELFTIWESLYNKSAWELFLMMIFSSLGWNNVGYIDWEPWLSQIFTRLLRGFSLPIGKMQMSSQEYTYFVTISSKWIVSMIGNGNSCLQYLRDLLFSIKSFYHPSNTEYFQEDLVDFIVALARDFLDRVHLERRTRPFWYHIPVESYRLTEDDITTFVNCVKDYVFISIFNKNYDQEAAEACQYLSILRPEIIIPTIMEKHFSSIENLIEPHRLISIMNCLKHIARQIVQQTSSYSAGQIYVLPLLMSVLPAIDLNDMEKTFATLEFLETILALITCIDCSAAVKTRNDLTEIEKEVCLSTSKFEDFIIEFLNRIFDMVDTLSFNMSDAVIINTDIDIIDLTIEAKLTSIIFNIVQHCGHEIFQKIREKIMNFAFGRCLSSNVHDIVSSLVEALIKSNPSETLKYFLPKTTDSIEQILNNSDSNIFIKENLELNWYFLLFTKLVRARGDVLLIYKKRIMSIFHQCIHIMNKNSYGIVANAAKSLLESLTQLYPIDYRLTMENIDPPFVEFLPIRAWGKSIDYDKLQAQFHIPNEDEIDFASEFVHTFIYAELNFLNEHNSKLSNNERLRSLTLIQSIAIGCFRLIPRIESDQVQNLMPSVVSSDSKYQMQYSIYFKELKLKENLRLRLLIDIGKLLDELIENHSDDVSSITQALEFYSYISIFYGLYEMSVKYSWLDVLSREKLLQNKLCNKGQSIRSLTIEKMALQIQKIEVSQFGTFTDIDQEIVLKLFELSTNRYSEIRQRAQMELFNVLNSYQFSFEVIVDRIVQLLSRSEEVDHDQIKGCLYILLGDNTFFLPTKYSWIMREKLWPVIASMTHATKISTQNLIEKIGKKISDTFVSNVIIQNTNEISRHAASDLWHLLELNEIKVREEYNSIDVQSYNNLMEILSSLLESASLTWGQQNLTMSFLCLLLQTHVPIPLSCIKAFVDSLVHENMDLRKYAEKGIATICHLQKFPRIYVEKSLEEILHNIGQPIPTVIHEQGHPGDRDDNFWVTIDDYQLPQTQIEWEQTCFLDKSFYGYYCWPKIIKYSINKRDRYTLDNMPEEVAVLYDRFSDRNFLIQAIELMLLDEGEDEDLNFSEIRFAMYKGLFRNFGLAFLDNFMEQLYILVREKANEKQLGSHRIASEMFAGIIRGAKYWTLEMLNELWEKLTPLLTEVWINLTSETLNYWSLSFKYIMKEIDPRRMYRLIHFFHTLIDNKTTLSTTNEISRWTLIHRLNHFNWRIPSLWCEINEHARLVLDHASDDVRYRIAAMLAMSISFDIKLFHGQATRHPKADEFIDNICQRLHQAIEVYEQTTLMNISDQNIEMNLEARQAINLIETVIQMHTLFYIWSHQPIKNSIIRLFFYLCEMESITTNDHTFKENLTMSRFYIGMSYLNSNFFELLIQQLTHVCASSKWHARQAAIEFAQNMIFCNLFNARPYAERLHKLVLKCLVDEQFEVRIAASTTLSGFYQCGYIQVTEDDLTHFRLMSKTNYVTKIDGEKVILAKNMIKRHGGVLGLCAIVLSSPYDIPTYVPDALMLLCERWHDPDLIQKSIKTCLSEFRRTHHDSWHEHRDQFTEDQLAVLADVFISHSYYA